MDIDTKLLFDVALVKFRGTDSAAAFLNSATRKSDCSVAVFPSDPFGYRLRSIDWVSSDGWAGVTRNETVPAGDRTVTRIDYSGGTTRICREATGAK